MERADSRPSTLAAAAHVILIVAALHFAEGLFIPLALAALISLLLLPLVKGVERVKIGRIPSILVVALTAFLVIGAFGWLTMRQLSDLGRNLPEYRGRVIAKAGSLGPVGRAIQESRAALAELEDGIAESTAASPPFVNSSPTTKVEMVPSLPKPLDLIGRAFVSGAYTLGTTVFVLILVIFFLIYHVDLMDRLVHMAGNTRVNVTTQTVTEAVKNVSRYLFLQTAVNAGFGLVVALGVGALGLPNALLFGILAALSRFIPYVGVWVAVIPPLLLSIALSDGWTRPLAILGGWLVVETAIANVLEPWVYGSKTGLSPLAVILSAFFWTWMWGATGLLLAAPLTVSLVVLGKYLPHFAFFQTLLGSKAPLEPKVQLYNRLLALDQREAVDLVDRYQVEKPAREIYDGLLLPALCMAESDRQQGRLDEERETTMLKNIGDLIQDLGERFEAERKPEGGAEPAMPSIFHRIVCLPAGRSADRVAASMVTQLLAGTPWHLDIAPEHSTAGEMVEFITSSETRLVVISAIPPFSLIQARYLCKRIRRLHPKVAIVIGLWNDGGDLESLRKRITPDSDAHVVTTLTQAVDQIRQICQSVIPPPSQSDTRLRTSPH